MSEKQQPWPEFEKRAAKILAEVVTPEVAGELAVMLAEVADKMRPRTVLNWPSVTTTGGYTSGSGNVTLTNYPMWSPHAAEVLDPDDLTDDEKKVIAEQFQAGKACPHCGGIHERACPRVRRLVFHGAEIAEVEFWRDDEWPHEYVLWPEDFPPDAGQ
jgi:hypothetical protein